MNDFDEENGKTLAGFNFASHHDQLAAMQLHINVLKAQMNRGSGPFPLVVIQGPAASGKTTLVQRVTESIARSMTVSGHDLERGMMQAVAENMTALVFETMPVKLLREKLPLLMEYARSDMWEVRRLREDPRKMGKCLVTIVITSERVPADLLDVMKVQVVKLRARKEGAGV